MKKNYMMRLAAVLLVLVLLSTCVISGTFAKYVTGVDVTDKAQVAKWGITLKVEGDDTLFNEDGNGNEVSAVVKANDLAAPGTYQKLAQVKLTGTPEVKYTVSVAVTLNLTGWEVAANTEYCPLEFTVGGTTYSINNDEKVADFAARVVKAINQAICGNEFGTATYNAGTSVPTTANSVLIGWTWKFAGNDVNDTILGNNAAGGAPAKIDFSLAVTVTQEN